MANVGVPDWVDFYVVNAPDGRGWVGVEVISWPDVVEVAPCV